MATRPLEIIAPADKPILVTRRAFDADRALVFEAWTRPELMRRWLGPKDLSWVTCEMDLRPGGRYRWVQRAPDGQEFAFHGVFREVVRPERLVSTFVFEAQPEDEALETLTLQAQEGGTLATTLSVHGSIAARDAHLCGGEMEKGMVEGYERLDAILASLRAGAEAPP